jgi:hypothetical protein
MGDPGTTKLRETQHTQQQNTRVESLSVSDSHGGFAMGEVWAFQPGVKGKIGAALRFMGLAWI